MPFVERGDRQASCRVHLVGVGGEFRERLLNALEHADRQAELLAHARIGAGHARRHRRGGGGLRGSEMPRPVANAFISMVQPSPICASPPRIQSIGMKTSSP